MSHERMSQKAMILNHLRTHLGITDNQARDIYSVNRLSARIHELREAGHEITDVWREEPNQFGRKCRFVEYRLVGDICRK